MAPAVPSTVQAVLRLSWGPGPPPHPCSTVAGASLRPVLLCLALRLCGGLTPFVWGWDPAPSLGGERCWLRWLCFPW